VFITIDGPNGVGKTSVSIELATRLRQRGLPVTLVRQPSDSELGSYTRAHHQNLTGWPLAALVVADRHIQIENEIKPALTAGATVISDRYVASTLVLQRLDGLDPAVIWEVSGHVLVPDLNILLTADVPTLYARLTSRGRVSRFDQMDQIAEREVIYYVEAAEVLRRAGYRVAILDTDRVPVSGVVDRVLDEVDRTDLR
jgi:dTMP kinase